MATRSFLLDDQRAQGLELLLGQGQFPAIRGARVQFSDWLSEQLRQRLEAIGGLQEARPILVGSWSRQELSPKSDIDILFAGPEEHVKEFVAKAFGAGLKLRSRVPEDPDDWSVGVEPFDVLALSQAASLYPSEQNLLPRQIARAYKARRSILSAIKKEREDRRKRQDSIANHLEPNLKFGAGGLRDIEQALALRQLFPENFAGHDDYPFEVLREIKDEFLFLRSLLHLLNSSDVLSAHDQIELANRLKFESPSALMKFVQRELERASFYADWAVAVCSSSGTKRRVPKMAGPLEAVGALRKDPANILIQYEIRREVDGWGKAMSPREAGRILQKALRDDPPDALLVAIHRSRLLEILLPDFKKLKGLVQHDHYHRFTADAHLVQTLREVQRLKSSKRIFGAISALTKDLDADDWWILKLTALFHDLAKGRKGDHSTEGAKLVDRYFAQWD